MTAGLGRPRPDGALASIGRGPARRAMRRWAWRLFRSEWRQQLLVLALIVVAVGATVVASAVAANTPPSPQATFGTAQDLAVFGGAGTHPASKIAALRKRFGATQVIEEETRRVPGSSTAYQLRAQSPHGRYSQPLLALVAGRYPTGPHQVALTAGLAADFGVAVDGTWRGAGTARTVVGIVEDPQSLLSEFALVPPDQVAAPTKILVLFDAGGVPPFDIGPTVRAASHAAPASVFNPETIVLAIATVGMLLIALVAVGGFTVLAQRRLRAIGMVEAIGATDADVRFLVRANGAVVGVIGAVLGCALGIVAWLAYRPTVQRDAHHVIGTFALPWIVIGPAMVLAVLATYAAASRPARAVSRVPVVAALAGRPAPPRQVHRSVVPGLVLLAGAAALFSAASAGKSVGILVPAFVALIAAVILLAPAFLAVLGRVGRWAPVSVRLALRDLSRYRARSSSALSAISLGVLIAVVVAVIAAGRYGNPLDYAGPNLASNQVILHITTPGLPGKGVARVRPDVPGVSKTAPPAQPQHESATQLAAAERSVASALGSASSVKLESTDSTLLHAAKGRNFSGPLFVATPALLRAFGIAPSQVDPNADVLTMRPGLASETDMLLVHGSYFSGSPGPRQAAPGAASTFPCPEATCLADPVIQEVAGLPSGTSAPNTVVTEHAVQALHLHTTSTGWLLTSTQPPSAGQIANARAVAASSGLRIETKSSAPSSSEIIDGATVFGIALALGILAMSVGLIRSETAKDLRTLAAAGATSFARRAVTAATAGGLALLGAVLGTVAGYVACVSWFRSTGLTGPQALSHVPVANLALIVVGMPLLAVVVGWLLAGREPTGVAHQPIE